MAMGPVQILVVGFGEGAEFKGEALAELQRLSEADIVRVIDLLVVHKSMSPVSRSRTTKPPSSWPRP